VVVYLLDPVRLAVAACLSVAGLSKIATPIGMTDVLQSLFRVLQRKHAHVFAVLVGVAEVGVSVLLLVHSPTLVRLGALGLLVLSLGIVAVVAISVRRPSEIPCGCFGAASTKAIGKHNLLYAAAGIVVAAAVGDRGSELSRAPYGSRLPSALSICAVFLTLFIHRKPVASALRTARGNLVQRLQSVKEPRGAVS
jgi:uncharacterized membrane protein YphA (DoxX/SURF4 family)